MTPQEGELWRDRQSRETFRIQGWPITDQDPSRETVSTYFGVCDRTIRNWMRTAFSEMRNALGVSHEQ